MEINNSSATLNNNPLESSEPTKNTTNQQNISSTEQQLKTNTSKPSYLRFLRSFAGLSMVLAIFAGLALFFIVLGNANRGYGAEKSSAWIIALALALEGLLAYGLLNAVADIAENMIEVGSYVRELRRQNKS